MRQFIAPRMLRVNGRPAPCECHHNVICEYCVQANLILWERREAKFNIVPNLLKSLKEMGPRKASRITGVPRSRISTWLNGGSIPSRHIEKLRKAIPLR